MFHFIIFLRNCPSVSGETVPLYVPISSAWKTQCLDILASIWHCHYFSLVFVIAQFVNPWTAACQASLSFTITQSSLKLRSIELVMPFNHLILCCPLHLLPSIFPSFGVFSNTLATWCKNPAHWKRSWCWERLRAGGEGGNREWDGWMASPTQWTWVSSGSWWWTGKLGMLQSMRSQRVGHDWVTELSELYEWILW